MQGDLPAVALSCANSVEDWLRYLFGKIKLRGCARRSLGKWRARLARCGL